jgi:hypothetical protein
MMLALAGVALLQKPDTARREIVHGADQLHVGLTARPFPSRDSSSSRMAQRTLASTAAESRRKRECLVEIVQGGINVLQQRSDLPTLTSTVNLSAIAAPPPRNPHAPRSPCCLSHKKFGARSRPTSSAESQRLLTKVRLVELGRLGRVSLAHPIFKQRVANGKHNRTYKQAHDTECDQAADHSCEYQQHRQVGPLANEKRA